MAKKKPAFRPQDLPAVDEMGRTKCTKCLGYTANPSGMHGWCEPGMNLTKWANQWPDQNKKRK